MPRRDELQQQLYSKTQSYSLLVEGTPALLRSETITQEDLNEGDAVILLAVAGGKTFLSKVEAGNESAYTIGRITPAHIYFSNDIDMEEAVYVEEN